MSTVKVVGRIFVSASAMKRSEIISTGGRVRNTVVKLPFQVQARRHVSRISSSDNGRCIRTG